MEINKEFIVTTEDIEKLNAYYLGEITKRKIIEHIEDQRSKWNKSCCRGECNCD